MFEGQISRLILKCEDEIEALKNKVSNRAEVKGYDNYCEFYDDKVDALVEIEEIWTKLLQKWKKR